MLRTGPKIGIRPYHIKRHPDYDPSLRWMLPAKVRGPINFQLLAVWAMNHRIPQTEVEEISGQPLEAMERCHAFLAGIQTRIGRSRRNSIFDNRISLRREHQTAVCFPHQVGHGAVFVTY